MVRKITFLKFYYYSSMVSSEVAKKQREFVGRIKAGQGIAKLYVSLEKEHE